MYQGLLRRYEFHSSLYGAHDAKRDLLIRLIEDEKLAQYRLLGEN